MDFFEKVKPKQLLSNWNGEYFYLSNYTKNSFAKSTLLIKFRLVLFSFRYNEIYLLLVHTDHSY